MNVFHSSKFLFLVLFLLNISVIAADWPGKKSDWKGFTRYDFKINDKSSFVVVPKKAASDNVWVWRARFPGWHTEMDELLLKKGFHIAYTDVSNLYGSAKAISQWDTFYKEMTEKYGLAKKVALECVSRGGLIAYNWAKKNPEKVACIYAEAPVCDIKSWPGGKGSGKGSAGDWKKAQAAYGMSEDELMKWQGNPIHGLEALAKARVPVLHVVCMEDKIVPTNENTLKLFENYVKLGGIMTISPNLKGPFKLEGHHFPIEHVEDHAEFIIRHTLKHL